MLQRPIRSLWLLGLLTAVAGCASAQTPPANEGPGRGLLLALSQFEVSPEGKVLPRPGAALLEILVPRGDGWEVVRLEDPDSNVFHKAMVFDSGGGAGPGILTLGGSAAAVKLWRKGSDGLEAETLWATEFGGKHNRMREAETLPWTDGRAALAVATHDQGVVALVHPADGGWQVRELDRKKNTFVHEIEIGDLDGDGKPEIYATPSEPNKLDGSPQRGKVLRYLPDGTGKPVVVADLGDRHAKEILVDDVDGDGRDELYVSVEAVAGGRLEIRRYDAKTDPAAGVRIGTLDDKLCRFLTSGDLDGDGRKEIVAAAHRTGLWLFRPPSAAGKEWVKTSIDRGSSGFEHAAILADLDADGTDELYVASDDQGEVRRYVLDQSGFTKTVLYRREIPDSVFTWNITPVPLGLIE